MTTLLEQPRTATVVRRRLGRGPAFWAVAATTATLLAASSAPSPLYPVYQAEYGFSPLTLTGVFAVYVLALLASLLTVGRLSDVLGRRPVLAAALVVEAAAMAVFLDAHGVAALFAARVVQGLATGAAVGVLGAYLLDLQPAGSRLGAVVNGAAATGGLGLGAAGTGVLIQYGPHPTRLVFALLTVAFLGLAAMTAALPETVTATGGARAVLRPRVSVPGAARTAFLRATPIMTSTWMLGGLMLSVGGSLLGSVFAQRNHAVVGAVIGLFAGAAALTSVLLRARSAAVMARFGTLLLIVGTALFAAGVQASSLPLFVTGAVIAGAGFGPAFLGAFGTLSQLAAPHERAALISAIYVVSYLAFSLPALVAGVLITHAGLRETSLGYAIVVGAVVAATLGYEVVVLRRRASTGRA